MKHFLIGLLMWAACAAQGQANLNLTNWTFTNLQGRVYSNTTLRSASATNIAVAWEPYGYAKIDFTNLPEDIRQMFHYDPAKAADVQRADAAQKLEQAEMLRVKKTQRRELMEVLQVIPEGVLANAVIGVREQTAQAAVAGQIKLDYLDWRRDLVMLWHYPGKTYDGAYIIVTYYPIGTYQYTSVKEIDKTVPRVTAEIGTAIEYSHNPNAAIFRTDSELASVAESKRLPRELKPNNVLDSVKDTADSKPTASGSGFFITDDGYLISNYHVVKNAERIRLVTSAGLIAAKVVRVDEANDLALLKAEGKFASLPITASRGMKLGGTVATVGFPDIMLQGFSPKFAKGEIASLSGATDDPRYFQVSVPVQPGNSGGALVDEHGNVVGVVSAKLNAFSALAESGSLPENVNYAVKSSFLLSFLESVPDVSAKLTVPNTKERNFEDVVKSAEQAAVLVLVY